MYVTFLVTVSGGTSRLPRGYGFHWLPAEASSCPLSRTLLCCDGVYFIKKNVKVTHSLMRGRSMYKIIIHDPGILFVMGNGCIIVEILLISTVKLQLEVVMNRFSGSCQSSRQSNRCSVVLTWF